jgi:NlpC/P60 family putative phage cell wall peptidase
MSAHTKRILAAADTWLNTPYQHQASQKGVGCDCLGLVRGIWRDLYGSEMQPDIPPYGPDWAERSAHEPLVEGLGRHFLRVDAAQAQAGDVLAFRLKPHVAAKHCALFTTKAGVKDPQAVIMHAYWGHAVVRSYLFPFWARRIAACFRFPQG